MDPSTAPKFGSFPRRRKAIESVEEAPLRSDVRHIAGRRREQRGESGEDEIRQDSFRSYASDRRPHRSDRKHRPTHGEYDHNDRYQPRKEEQQHSSRKAHHCTTSHTLSTVPSNVMVEPSGSSRIIDQSSELWTLDYTGDKQNLTFGSLHKYSVPTYNRYGRGKVIGVPSSLRISLLGSTAEQVSLERPDRGREREPRLLTSKAARTTSEPDLSLLISGVDEVATFDNNEDFIPVAADSQQDAVRPTAAKGAGLVDAVYLRGLKAEVDSTNEFTKDTMYIYSVPGRPQAVEPAAQQRNGMLIKASKEQPTDFNIWKRLADHQIDLYFPGRSSESLTANERHRLDEMRCSVYEKALRSTASSCSGREHVNLLYLRLATLVEEEPKAQRLWKQALSNYPNHFDLSFAYIGYLQTLPTIDLESIRAAYQQAFIILQKERERADVSVSGRQIHLLLRFTNFLRDVGYDELALALWQCVMDLQLTFWSQRQPDTKVRLLAKLNEWWELDIARLGEPGALPFAQWLESTFSPEFTERTPCSTNDLISTPHNRSEWLKEEWKLQAHMHLPAVPDEDTADPQRFVLWDDLRTPIGCLLSPLPRAHLLSAWLLHLSLPPAALDFGPSIRELVRWQADDMLQASSSIPNGSVPDFVKPDQLPLSKIIVTSRSLFDSKPFAAFRKSKPLTAHGASESFPRYVQRTLQTLVHAAQMDVESYTLIAEYLIAFTGHTFPDEVAKVSKKLIKAQPANIMLYNAYASSWAMSENTSGLGRARDIWTAALSKTNDFNHSAPLRRDWAWTEFWLGNYAMSMMILQSSSQETPFISKKASDLGTATANQRLRTTQFLRDAFDRNIHSHNYATAVACADMIALFSYLAENANISMALDAVEVQLKRLEGEVEAFGSSECLLQSLAQLIKVHMGRARQFQLGLLLEFAGRALNKHPDNSMFLDLHYCLLHQNRVNDRLRLEASSVAVDIDSASDVVWSHKLAEEIRRWQVQPPSGTPSSVRVLFQNALCNPRSRARHSADLWSLWLRFELSLGQGTDRPSTSQTQVSATQNIRAVLYNGSRALPWNKKWLIDSMHAMNTSQRDLLGHGDIAQAVAMISNRGLRLMVTFPD